MWQQKRSAGAQLCQGGGCSARGCSTGGWDGPAPGQDMSLSRVGGNGCPQPRWDGDVAVTRCRTECKRQDGVHLRPNEMGSSLQGWELCLWHRRGSLHRFCCRRAARRARAGLSSPILWDWGHPLLVPTSCSSPPWHHSRSINLHPTALGMDLFKTPETPKSHHLAAFRARSLGIKMMGCRCLHPAASPGQAKDVMQQING